MVKHIASAFVVACLLAQPAFAQDAKVGREQHEVRGVLGHIHCRIHRDTDIGGVQRKRIVDTVPQVPHDMTAALQAQILRLENFHSEYYWL